MVNFRKEEFPFVGSYFLKDGIQRHYLDEGQGRPVVMLHGNPTWSFYYRALIRELKQDHRVIVPDHVGCGLSDKPKPARYSYTLEQRVEDLEALLDHLGVEGDVTLVMHDWGGMIGMAYAVRNVERVKRLVLMNTAAFHLPENKRLPWQLWLCRNTFLGEFMVRRMNAFALGALRSCTMHAPLPRTVRDGYLAPYNSYENRVGVYQFVKDIPLNPGDPSYDLVQQTQEGLAHFRRHPALLLWGENDFVFDSHFLEQWRRFLPNAELHRFPNAGHYVLEDAREEIVPLVRRFLDKHPGPAGGGG